jgi:hypothetical protein
MNFEQQRTPTEVAAEILPGIHPNRRDAPESASLVRVKHLQLGDAIVGAAEPPA